MRLYFLKCWFSAPMFWNKEAIKNIPSCKIRIFNTSGFGAAENYL